MKNLTFLIVICLLGIYLIFDGWKGFGKAFNPSPGANIEPPSYYATRALIEILIAIGGIVAAIYLYCYEP